nr:MAG: capsid protein [Chaphamaparvovirus sp.]UNY48114.1 MAG: capsid protein [Chaphamaparvovirus sp.]
MTETIKFQNVYMTYIDNNPYQYPSIEVANMIQGTIYDAIEVNTGWHIIPNFLWRQCIIPRQWDSLVRNCEAYCVKGIKGTIFNPIPITHNISLQRTSLFSAFNNCTYAMTYTDDKYETDWFPWNTLERKKQLHLSQREGLVWTGTQTDAQHHTPTRYQWPIYSWRKPYCRNLFDDNWSQGKSGQAGVYDTDATTSLADSHQAIPNGVFWDPFNCADEIGELRAGKNSIEFSWAPADCDANKFFNLDWLAAYSTWTVDGPFQGEGRPWTLYKTIDMDPGNFATYGLAMSQSQSNTGSQPKKYQDYTVPNMFNMPIMPTTQFWIEIKNSIVDWYGESSQQQSGTMTWFKKPDKYWSGTEYEACTYPPQQWFCKGIPIYDAGNNPIKTTTQVSFRIEITLEGRKRRSAYFAPTYGPTSGDQLYYQHNSKGIFQPACIRYRTGGRRRAWQNMNTPQAFGNNTENKNNLDRYPRQDCYQWKYDAASIGEIQYNQHHRPVGIGDDTSANHPSRSVKNIEKIRVTWSRDTDSTEIHMDDEEEQSQPKPEPRKRSHDIMKLMHLK